jgi:transposase InsO family protein
MSLANPLWGAPRIHGELLKLGIEVVETTVAKYMVKGGRLSSQTWKTFLRNHAAGIAAMDFLVVPAQWVARQIRDAFPWNETPRYLIRDRDAAYGHAVRRRLQAMGIRDHPTAPRSPWQNAYAEAADRFHPPGLPRSYYCARRNSSPLYPQSLCQLLQRRADSSIAEEGRSHPALHRAGWTNRFDTDS